MKALSSKVLRSGGFYFFVCIDSRNVMQKRKIKNTFSIIFMILVFCGTLCFTPVLIAEDQKKNWSSSYDFFRSRMKSLSKSKVVYCEKILREILNDLDTRNKCNDDANCVLIDQKPFGETVPFAKKYFVSMKRKMKEYCDRCDDGFYQFVEPDDLINTAVCIDGKCMVSTGFKKENSK